MKFDSIHEAIKVLTEPERILRDLADLAERYQQILLTTPAPDPITQNYFDMLFIGLGERAKKILEKEYGNNEDIL